MLEFFKKIWIIPALIFVFIIGLMFFAIAFSPKNNQAGPQMTREEKTVEAKKEAYHHARENAKRIKEEQDEKAEKLRVKHDGEKKNLEKSQKLEKEELQKETDQKMAEAHKNVEAKRKAYHTARDDAKEAQIKAKEAKEAQSRKKKAKEDQSKENKKKANAQSKKGTGNTIRTHHKPTKEPSPTKQIVT
ncbi:MAG: hypothetical protein S4CHLAM102_15680 [Chlamydiia bacterium]|nr:hypothetical protein [Chlamydiia bacterium]